MLSLKPSAGLPLYRPDVLVPKPENRGTAFLTYTFDRQDFLQRVLQQSRSYGVKLTAVLQSALYLAVYEFADAKPHSSYDYISTIAIDLRNNQMVAPYSMRNYYSFNAIAGDDIRVRADLLREASESAGFWKLVASLASQFASITRKTGLARKQDEKIKMFTLALSNTSS